MLNSLKSYLISAGAVLFAILTAFAAVMKGQRDEAKEKVEDAKRTIKVQKATRNKEQSVEKVRTEARQETEEVKKAHEQRPKGERPAGSFRR